MDNYETILSAARQLTQAERFQLSIDLHDDIDPDACPPLDAEWLAEANRRSDALDRGEMTTRPWSEVRAEARRLAGLDG